MSPTKPLDGRILLELVRFGRCVDAQAPEAWGSLEVRDVEVVS